MKIYLASRYGRWPEMQGCAEELRAMGHTVTSRWHNGIHEVDSDAPVEDRARLAREDCLDLSNADAIVVFTETPNSGSGGGHHVEFGLALAWGQTVYLVGPRVNVFHYLPRVTRFDNWRAFRAELSAEASCTDRGQWASLSWGAAGLGRGADVEEN